MYPLPPATRWVSAHANIRVASAARRSYGEALVICFRGGAFSAVLDITLCVAGVTLLYVTLYTCYVARGILEDIDIPVLMVGYGFGASFVALFMQVRAPAGANVRTTALSFLHIVQRGVAVAAEEVATVGCTIICWENCGYSAQDV